MKNKITFPLFVFVTVLSLVLAACQGATPTPETHDVPTVVEQQVEKEESIEEEASAGMIVSRTEDADLGSFLVDESGMSLYMFMNDAPGTSNPF